MRVVRFLLPAAILQSCALSQAAEPGGSRKDLYKSAQAHRAAGRFGEAISDLKKCLDLKPDDRKCNELLQEVRQARSEDLLKRQRWLPAFDIPHRKALAEEALREDPALGWARQSARRADGAFPS